MKEFWKEQRKEANNVNEPSQKDTNEEETEQDKEQERIRNKPNNLIMFSLPESNDAREVCYCSTLLRFSNINTYTRVKIIPK